MNTLRRNLITGGVLAIVCTFLFTISIQPVNAIPSFARKYETSCMTCHIAPPKLNAFGQAFRNNGYRMSENDEDLVKQEPVALGSPGWKRVFPKGVWPADIPGGTMLGFIVEAGYGYEPDGTVNNEFDGIEEIGLLLGGTVGESMSFFGDVDLFVEGEPGHIGRLFVQYNKPGGAFNLKLGQFEPRAAPFSNHMRMIRINGYLADTMPMLPAQNFFGFSPNQKGVELWGSREGPNGSGGLTWALGVVNGEPGGAFHAFEEVAAFAPLIEELEEHYEEFGGEFDPNPEKDFYVRANYKFGGLGVLGSGSADSLKQTNNWRDDSVTVGGYFYRGTTGAFVDTGDPLDPEAYFNDATTFTRAGFVVDAWYKDLNILANWQRNHDEVKNTLLVFTDTFETDISTLEFNYVMPWPWVQPAVRFEHVNPGFMGSFNRTSLSTTLLLRANVILGIEGSFASDGAPDLPGFEKAVKAGLRFLF